MKLVKPRIEPHQIDLQDLRKITSWSFEIISQQHFPAYQLYDGITYFYIAFVTRAHFIICRRRYVERINV